MSKSADDVLDGNMVRVLVLEIFNSRSPFFTTEGYLQSVEMKMHLYDCTIQ